MHTRESLTAVFAARANPEKKRKTRLQTWHTDGVHPLAYITQQHAAELGCYLAFVNSVPNESEPARDDRHVVTRDDKTLLGQPSATSVCSRGSPAPLTQSSTTV